VIRIDRDPREGEASNKPRKKKFREGQPTRGYGTKKNVNMASTFLQTMRTITCKTGKKKKLFRSRIAFSL